MNIRILSHRGAALVRLFVVSVVMLACLTLSGLHSPAQAGDNSSMIAPKMKAKGQEVPASIVSTVERLIAMTKDPSATFRQQDAAALLDFVGTEKSFDETELPERDGAQGVCVRSSIDAPLSRILQYGYNPDIPPYVVLPSVVRVSSWYPDSDMLRHRPKLWEAVDETESPVVLRGREFEQITPDSFSGAYYSYDLSRLLIVTSIDGRAALISVSLQDGPSSVGKKGGILDDATWDYVYSGEEGLTKGGIGWMDTYMYDSAAVSVYVENPEPGTGTSSMVFKWLRAGWAGMNVVRAKHIIAGCHRFSDAFREIIESEALPAPTTIAAKVREYMAMTNEELQALVSGYAQRLARRWQDHPLMERDIFARLFKNDRFAAELSREERISVLMKQYIRSVIEPGPVS
ncbi:hypothetical protein JCM16814_05100 [Desulfobaculum senezii]